MNSRGRATTCLGGGHWPWRGNTAPCDFTKSWSILGKHCFHPTSEVWQIDLRSNILVWFEPIGLYWNWLSRLFLKKEQIRWISIISSNSCTYFWSKENYNEIRLNKLKQGFVDLVFSECSALCKKCKTETLRFLGSVHQRFTRDVKDESLWDVDAPTGTTTESLWSVVGVFLFLAWLCGSVRSSGVNRWFMLLIHCGCFASIQSSDMVIGSILALSE